MNVKKRKELRDLMDEALDNIFDEIESNRFYPAYRNANSYLEELITAIGKKFGVVDFEALNKPYNMEELIAMIDGKNMDDIEGLKEIESFIRDNGESKYHYINTIYLYEPTGKHVCVENQCGLDNDFISFMGAHQTEL